jgi:hypothetical protein
VGLALRLRSGLDFAQGLYLRMRFIKFGLISLIIMAIVLFALSLLLPSHVRISRAINISAPVDSIMQHLRNMQEWPQWNALLADTAIIRASYGPDWIRTDQLQVFTVASVRRNWMGTRWVQPDGKEFQSGFELLPGQQFTVMQWYFDFYSPWYKPWEKFGSIIYDKSMGPSMEKSLTRLKVLVETSR